MRGSDPVLRARLKEITAKDAELHPRLMCELSSEISHSITLAPKELAPTVPIFNYNCFEFALGLAGDPTITAISSCLPATSCNTDFISYVLKIPLLLTLSSSFPDALVIYRDHECFTHAGVVGCNGVRSKWGTGQLWINGLFEVPTSYGDTVSYYRVKSPEEVRAAFIMFARQREGQEVVQKTHHRSPYTDGHGYLRNRAGHE